MDSLALARQYTDWFFAGEMDSLIAHYNPEVSEKPSREELMRRLDFILQNAGTEVGIVMEKFVKRNGQTQYWRASRFTSFPEPLLLRWVLTPEGYLNGMGYGPLSNAPPTDE